MMVMIRQKRNQLLRLLIFVVVTISVEGSTLPPITTPGGVFDTRTERFPIAQNGGGSNNGISGIGSGSSGIIPTYEDIDTFVPFRSDSHDLFSWQLLKTVLVEETGNNVIMSPFSVKLVLALLSEAAGINTTTQLELLNTQTDIKSLNNIREFYRKTLISFKKENQAYNTLNFRTKLFTDAFVEPQQKFKATLLHFYDTEIQRLNFTQPDEAVSAINAWSSNVTNGRLKNLVTEQNVAKTVMLLTNVIYFNGLWLRPFYDNYEGPFLKSAGNQLHVQYMEQTDNFYYLDSSEMNAKILRLPYKGKNSMFILLPKSTDGLEQLACSLENNQLKSMQWSMEEVKVKVTLPKFRIEYNKSLKSTLMSLGIQEIFTDHASLPGLTRGADVAGKVKVSDIFQKAGIDVNEKGTEAYAASVVEIVNKFGGASIIKEFHVNRPFIFFIEEEATGNILFAGKVHEPLI